jgi:hypothetical protein
LLTFTEPVQVRDKEDLSNKIMCILNCIIGTPRTKDACTT